MYNVYITENIKKTYVLIIFLLVIGHIIVCMVISIDDEETVLPFFVLNSEKNIS